MSLSYNHRNIADASAQGIHLKKVVGAYEVSASLNLQMQSSDEDEIYYLRIETVRLFVKGTSGGEQFIGTLCPYELRMLRTHDFSNRECVDLSLTLHPGQLSAIEDLRDGGDLVFILKIRGQAYLNSDEQRAYDDFSVHMPRSDWIQQLKNISFMDVLLIEVPFPATDLPERLQTVQHALEEAQRHFISAEYSSCVASCRTAIQELGHHVFGKKDWSVKTLKQLDENAPAMAKEDREKALFAVIRHYAHQAHHGEGEGGVRHYTRSEAQMILRMAAAAISGAVNFDGRP